MPSSAGSTSPTAVGSGRVTWRPPRPRCIISAPNSPGRFRIDRRGPWWGGAPPPTRRHKPGRAFERTGYRFDILCDYGIFRDLQRHRLLPLEWQRLDTRHGYVVPPAIAELGDAERWTEAMESAAGLAARLDASFGPDGRPEPLP